MHVGSIADVVLTSTASRMTCKALLSVHPPSETAMADVQIATANMMINGILNSADTPAAREAPTVRVCADATV